MLAHLKNPLLSLIRLLSWLLKLVLFVYSLACSNHTKPLFPISGVTNMHKKGLLVTMVLELAFLHVTHGLVGAKGSIDQFVYLSHM